MKLTANVAIIVTSVLLGVLALIGAYLVPMIMTSFNNEDNVHIGIVKEITNEVKVKHRGNFSWLELKENDKIYTNSKIFTDKNSHAKIILADQTEIVQEPLSLINVQYKIKTIDGADKKQATEQIDIVMETGNINVKATKNHKIDSVTSKSEEKKIKFKSNEEVEAKIKTNFDDEILMRLGKGEADLSTIDESKKVSAGEVVESSKSIVDVKKDNEVFKYDEDEALAYLQNNSSSSESSASSSQQDSSYMSEIYESYRKAFEKDKDIKAFMRRLAKILHFGQ